MNGFTLLFSVRGGAEQRYLKLSSFQKEGSQIL